MTNDVRHRLPIAAAVALTVLAAGAVRPPAALAEAVVGQPAPAFTLKDTKGNTHALADDKGKIVVLEWVNYECPFVKKHYESKNMQDLQKRATADGVVWLSINSSAPGKQGHYPPDVWNRLLEEKGASPTAVLLDPDGTVGKMYGAKTTPHMFVIDANGVLVYAGAIDSTPSTNPYDVRTATNYVSAALAEVAAGKPITTASTTPYGCSVKY